MTDETEDIRLVLARRLVVALENHDECQSVKILDEISGLRTSELFQEVGHLTRKLHDAMNGFAADSKISLAMKNMPDAKERLQYVITTTEEAANKTMGIVEALWPISKALNSQVHELSNKWDRILAKTDLSVNDFNAISNEITAYFLQTKEGLGQIELGLNDILIAQSFQDITGQIIRRVIDLVQNVESSLVDLVRLSDEKGLTINKAEIHEPFNELDLPGPVVPGVNDKANDVATNQDDVDDLLSSLGF